MSSLRNKILLLAVVVVTMYACTPKTVKTTTTNNYSEDLSIYRPDLIPDDSVASSNESEEMEQIEYVAPTGHLKTELDSVVALTTYYNDQKDYVEGYTIQVYTGTSRDDANKAQVKVYSVLGQASPWVDYRQPVYKVKVGKYYTKIEANKLYRQLKKKFPNALLIPQRFRLK